MTPEKQRIAIAEACGYTHVRIVKCIEGLPDHCIGHHPAQPHSIPDYLNDLNAMHEAEKVLDVNIESEDSARYEYSRQVYRIVESRRQPFRSTAAERAEAFLRTLGKWEGS